MNDNQAVLATVYLVGAGPGDPKLISLRGAELLRLADIVYFDYLVNPVMTAYANSQAELVCLGRHGHGRLWSQEEVNQALVNDARKGRTVVRLKGGDPAIFGRLSDEASYLSAHQIPFEVVPGITAASAASAYAGVLLTSRQSSSAVALVTGHELRGKETDAIDFDALANFPGTLVIYMGVTTASRWVEQLIRAGKAPDTPVALARRCSFSNQEVLRCALKDVPEQLTPYSKFAPPALAIVGNIVDQDVNIDWFAQRPLLGKTVLVTRPQHQQSAIADRLQSLGAAVLHQPAIQIAPAKDPEPLNRQLAQIDQHDWVVFSSVNGVRFFFEALFAAGHDSRKLGHCRLAAIGPSTADALKQYGLTADAVPSTFSAEALAACLLEDVRGHSVLLVRASRGRERLAETLIPVARRLEQVVVYESCDVASAAAEVAMALENREIDWITVTSSAIARSLGKMFGPQLHNAKLASISPLTSEAMREAGYTVAAEADEYTMEGIIEAIVTTEL